MSKQHHTKKSEDSRESSLSDFVDQTVLLHNSNNKRVQPLRYAKTMSSLTSQLSESTPIKDNNNSNSDTDMPNRSYSSSMIIKLESRLREAKKALTDTHKELKQTKLNLEVAEQNLSIKENELQEVQSRLLSLDTITNLNEVHENLLQKDELIYQLQSRNSVLENNITELNVKYQDLQSELEETNFHKNEELLKLQASLNDKMQIIQELTQKNKDILATLQEKDYDLEKSYNSDEHSTSSQLRLSYSTIKSIIQQAAIPNFDSLDNKSALNIITGYKSLLSDFMVHGRKQWNDKLVQKFLKYYAKIQSKFFLVWSIEGVSLDQQLDTNNQISPITAESLKKSQLIIQNILTTFELIKTNTNKQREELEEYTHQISEQLSVPHAKKQKFTTFQTIWNTVTKSLQSLHAITLEYCERQCKELQDSLLLSPIDLLNSIQQVIQKSLNSFRFPLSSASTTALEASPVRPAQELILEENKDPLDRILIKPLTDLNMSDIARTLGEDAIHNGIDFNIQRLKRTSNNNLLVTLPSTEATSLEQTIESSEKLRGKVAHLRPDSRRLQILLLSIPTSITDTDLNLILSHQSTFRKGNYKIVKSIPSKLEKDQHWVIEIDIVQGKHLLGLSTVNILLKRHKVVKYLKVARCTMCQAFDHVRHLCKNFKPICAKCADPHETQDCSAAVDRCINCLRTNKMYTNHNALSPNCPIYQEAKTKLLSRIYITSQSSQNSSHMPTNYRRQSNVSDPILSRQQHSRSLINPPSERFASKVITREPMDNSRLGPRFTDEGMRKANQISLERYYDQNQQTPCNYQYKNLQTNPKDYSSYDHTERIVRYHSPPLSKQNYQNQPYEENCQVENDYETHQQASEYLSPEDSTSNNSRNNPRIYINSNRRSTGACPQNHS